MARGGNTTGLHDDATDNALEKIENSTIPIQRSKTAAKISVQMKLTAGSTRVPTNWTLGGDSLAGTDITLSGSGLLSTLPAGVATAALGKTYKITISAVDGTGTIDTRGFTIAPSIGDEGTQIQLISPLPGAIVNSKFGPRMHPIQKVMKPHTGIDMKYSDRSVKDVVASADGEILLAGGDPSTGYGIRVWIKHSSGSGKHLCTTTYNHLNKVYVSTGQKVMAGQKVGLEGTTGSSTGNHLHFECRLPDGKFIDPEPLIRGSLSVASKTLSNGDADPSSVSTRTADNALAESEVEAKQAGCEAFGPAYPPANPAETTDPTPVVPPSTDPFELAWYFTMTHEVGPFWTNASPSDPDVAAGLIETSAQRKKCGYVNSPNFPGGETKFGVAQKPNPRLVVRSCTYDQAKNTGLNNYWKSSKTPCGTVGAYIGIMLFDMNYLHGDGNARTMYQAANIASVPPSASQSTQLAACQDLYDARVAFIRRIPRPEFTAGWLRRAKECLEYVQGLPPL
jgi:murein DD-endopeptidase MepM/ murein hydrolase activator NlpD